MARRQTKYKFPIEGEHHVVELYKGDNDDCSRIVEDMKHQARESGHTIRAISNGLELIAVHSSFPSVIVRRTGS